MDINKQIIDQRMTKIVADNGEWFEKMKEEKHKKAKAFVLYSVAAYLEMEIEEAKNLVTDGANDAGIDAIAITYLNNWEFVVTIFQCKYTFDLEKDSNFPANSIQRLIGAINTIFDAHKNVLVNDDLKPKVAEIRSLILENNAIPIVRCVCVNNGLTWTQEGENHIINAHFPENQVQFQHINHDYMIGLLQNRKPINTSLLFSGKSVTDEFNYKRVLIGKVNVEIIAGIFEKYGDSLLEKNIRNYLGLNGNKVNTAIQATLIGDKKDNFYFYNNGITMICNEFAYNGLQSGDWNVNIADLQVINGGQTCKTIQQTIHQHQNLDYSQAFVLVRLYALSKMNSDIDVQALINDITIATNSQNPVDLTDLRANDERQKKIELDMQELGYTYKRKKNEVYKGIIIPSSVSAEAVFTIWRRKPYLAKTKKMEQFGKFYAEIFDALNAAQMVIAVLIYRYCDTQRKKDKLYDKYPHLPYSNYFMAMIIGDLVLSDKHITIKDLTYKNFPEIKAYFEKNKDDLFQKAHVLLEKAIIELYDNTKIYKDSQRLSALFRRAELLETENLNLYNSQK